MTNRAQLCVTARRSSAYVWNGFAFQLNYKNRLSFDEVFFVVPCFEGQYFVLFHLNFFVLFVLIRFVSFCSFCLFCLFRSFVRLV